MNFPRCAVDKNDIKPRFSLLLQRDENAPPQTFLAAPLEPHVDAMPIAVAFRKIAPRAPDAQHIQNGAKNLIMRDRWRSPLPDITAFNQWQNLLPEELWCHRI